MVANPLYLPELREMLADNKTADLREFCTALHPARTAEFMEGLTDDEAWRVLHYAPDDERIEIFRYFDIDRQVHILENADRAEMGKLLGDLPPDDRVDILHHVEASVVDELLTLVPSEERRDILRLRSYPEDTAGAVMTTEFARLSENLSIAEAQDEVRRQAKDLETIYYLYVVDSEDHLRGIISLRELVLAESDERVADVMERDVVPVHVEDDQEEVAQVLARFDFLAIPVVDDERQILGIVTHDDVIDVVREEATEDAHRIGAIDPLEVGYLETHLFTLTWKRGMWMTILTVAALLTALALNNNEGALTRIPWLMVFIPLVISSGGNAGSQSATLIITALATGDIVLRDWARILVRELWMGLFLGTFLGMIGYVAAVVHPETTYLGALVVPLTLICVVICGTLFGSLLPLAMRRLGLDPALMSNPLVAGFIDIIGVVIYMWIATLLLEGPAS